MRKLLTAAGWTARSLLWIVKGLLLLLAVATLVLWPMSRGKFFLAGGSEYTEGTNRMDFVLAYTESNNGRIIVSYEAGHYLRGPPQGLPMEVAATIGKGWRWKAVSGAYAGVADALSGGWGPLRWQFEAWRNPDYAAERRRIAVSCWLLAPLLAACPLSSLTLLMRRRTRRRRTAGHCPQCGYDLRATPNRCPECGHMPAAVTANTNTTAKSRSREEESATDEGGDAR